MTYRVGVLAVLQFDWTISLNFLVGSIIVVAGTWAAISRLYSLLDKRLSIFESVLGNHANQLVAHSSRMQKQEDDARIMGNDLHEIVGRLKAWTNHNNK